MRVGKRNAVTEQIEQAIQSLFGNLFASAVTLAGAAETALPQTDDPDRVLFDSMKKHGPERMGLGKKQFITHCNDVRDWLKHKPDVVALDVREEDAVIMILRAYTKFTTVFGDEATTPAMQDFEAWFRKNYKAWLAPRGKSRPG